MANVYAKFVVGQTQISFGWIRSINKEFKPFIENRLIEIRRNIDVNDWYYCRSEINPADLITRKGNNVKPTWLWTGFFISINCSMGLQTQF